MSVSQVNDVGESDVGEPELKALQERVELLERRTRRLAAERNKARADYARLATVVQPFANQTARSFRQWIDSVAPDELYRLSKALAEAMTADTPHAALAQLIVLSEALAIELDSRRLGKGTDLDVNLYADRILRKLDQIYPQDDPRR